MRPAGTRKQTREGTIRKPRPLFSRISPGEASAIARNVPVTISSGLSELRGAKKLREAGAGRVRAPDGGRKKVEEADSALECRR